METTKLTLGTRVKHIDSCLEGKIVSHSDEGYKILIDNVCSPKFWYSRNTKSIEPAITTANKPVGVDMTKNENTYSFHSTSPFDIDWQAIIADLTRKNPMVIITIGENARYVVIHRSLKIKAQACGIDLPDLQHKLNADVFKINEQFAPWIAFAKKVKQAPWPTEIHNKTVVKITTIKL